MTTTYITGDVRDVLAAIPDGTVDLVLTSPPFLALRSYLPADHPDKHREIGAEPDPAGFLSTLLGLSAEWRRVLAPHGSICVELGDTYSGTGGAGGDWSDSEATTKARVAGGSDAGPPRRALSADWPMPKSLCGIPHLYYLSLAYGRNLLTGEPSPAGRWRIRNVVAWCRPNPPVGALGDKFRPATSYMTVATVASDRYFDLDAVRTEHTEPGAEKRKTKNHSGANPSTGWATDNAIIRQNPAGAPPLDWWEIPTQPYAGSHYAVWPPALLDRPIRSMVPRKVCTVCGQPSRRIVESSSAVQDSAGNLRPGAGINKPTPIGGSKATDPGYGDQGFVRLARTLGWSDCGHDAWRPGIVLDPFAGSGTTLMVASGHGLDSIGIDLDPRNVDLARERVGMFLEAYTFDEWKDRANGR